MSKEDLSITYENNIFYCTKNNTKWISVDGEKWYGEEKHIAELEAQIEKMKCCEMCKHKNLNWGFSSICEARDKIKIENPLTCKCDKWEIKENEN